MSCGLQPRATCQMQRHGRDGRQHVDARDGDCGHQPRSCSRRDAVEQSAWSRRHGRPAQPEQGHGASSCLLNKVSGSSSSSLVLPLATQDDTVACAPGAVRTRQRSGPRVRPSARVAASALRPSPVRVALPAALRCACAQFSAGTATAPVHSPRGLMLYGRASARRHLCGPRLARLPIALARLPVLSHIRLCALSVSLSARSLSLFLSVSVSRSVHTSACPPAALSLSLSLARALSLGRALSVSLGWEVCSSPCS